MRRRGPLRRRSSVPPSTQPGRFVPCLAAAQDARHVFSMPGGQHLSGCPGGAERLPPKTDTFSPRRRLHLSSHRGMPKAMSCGIWYNDMEDHSMALAAFPVQLRSDSNNRCSQAMFTHPSFTQIASPFPSFQPPCDSSRTPSQLPNDKRINSKLLLLLEEQPETYDGAIDQGASHYTHKHGRDGDDMAVCQNHRQYLDASVRPARKWEAEYSPTPIVTRNPVKNRPKSMMAPAEPPLLSTKSSGFAQRPQIQLGTGASTKIVTTRSGW